MRDLLKEAMPPVDGELRHDLWPRMRERMDRRPVLALSRFDWALIAAVVAWMAFFPHSVLVLLYHL